MKNSGLNRTSEAANAFVIVPFSTVDEARCFAAGIEPIHDGPIVTRGTRAPWSEAERAGFELTLEGWRVKVAGSGTVVMTDRL